MNREIRFRGKRVDNRKWIMGHYVEWIDTRGNMNYQIVSTSGYHNDVMPETVGMFSGLYDRTGKEIYDGDVVRVYPLGYNPDAIENSQGYAPYLSKVEWVLYPDKLSETCYEKGHGFLEWRCVPFTHSYQFMEVVGNVYENKELINK